MGHSWLNGWGIYGLNGWGGYGLNGWGGYALNGWSIYDLNGWDSNDKVRVRALEHVYLKCHAKIELYLSWTVCTLPCKLNMGHSSLQASFMLILQ